MKHVSVAARILVAWVSVVSATPAALSQSAPPTAPQTAHDTSAATSVRLCVVDATTGAPLVGTVVSAANTVSERGGAVTHRGTADGQCLRVSKGTLRLRRVGYIATMVTVQRDTIVALFSIARPAELLASVRIEEQRVTASSTGRMSETLMADDARASGAFTATGLVERLPFTALRSARGESTVSLRGARREQVVVTLDGLPLNDPSTGVADLADIPLVALGSATVVLGADPLGVGSGATGGVLSLNSAASRMLTVRSGSLGQRSIDGAWTTRVASSTLTAALRHASADNNFAFDNTAGATDVVQRERRINNDETRSALLLGALGGRWQATALVSRADRGMVGAQNVRTNDADRARTNRAMFRSQVSTSAVQVVMGARYFDLAYRDPNRPALDSDARAFAADLAAQGTFAKWLPTRSALQWRVGGGGDGVRSSGGIAQSRGRAFSSVTLESHALGLRSTLGARIDAIGGAGTVPSYSLATERSFTPHWQMFARAAQAVRAPTLYDLYFASPQRLYVPTLRPERVRLDAELGTRISRTTAVGVVGAEASLVTRETRDAIVWFPGNFGWSPGNVGVERLQGLESRIRVAPRWGEFSVWTTHYDAQLTSGALQIPTPYVARAAGGASISARRGQTSASLLARAMGRRPFSAGPRDRAYELPAVTLVDIAVTHPLPRRLVPSSIESAATWSLDNVGNVAWHSVRGFPSPGRTWALAVTLRHHPLP